MDPWCEAYTVALLGFSPWSAQRLLDAILAGAKPSGLPGDFVLTAQGTAQGAPVHLIATSAIGVRPYFIVDRQGPALHGPDVFALAAGRAWDWHLPALRALAWVGHTVDDQSLHPEIRRVPPDAVMVHKDGSWKTRSGDFWTTVFRGSATTPDEGVSVFGEVMTNIVHSDPLVSLSAGFDSRALLAWTLAAGLKPVTLTMGNDDSTDVVISRRIAAAERLDHHVVKLDPNDYLSVAETVTRLTGGTKLFGNWHTFLYTRGQVARQHLVGSNGEFARTFYLDRGRTAQLAALGRLASVDAYWVARVLRRSQRMAPWLPFLGGKTEAVKFGTQIGKLANDGGGDGLEQLDRFYAKHRVRHFIGNGTALYAHHGTPVSPFLDARWLRVVAGLNRRDKLGSNYHRYLISQTWPRLLEHPVAGRDRMEERAPKQYWRGAPPVSYSPAPVVIAGSEVKDILVGSKPLRDLLSANQLTNAATTGTSEVKEYLLTLHFAGDMAGRI